MRLLSTFKHLPTWLLVLLPLVLFAALFYALWQILQKIGLVDTANAAANADALKDAIKSGVDVPKGDKLTQTLDAWKVQANNLYLALKDSTINDKPLDAWRVLYSVKSASDWNALQSGFGLRQNYFFGFKDGVEMPVTAFIIKNLASDAIQRYREDMIKKGIKINL